MSQRSNFDPGMRTRLPPNVTRELNRHGKPVFYYRVGKGPRVRLADYGTPQFEADYQACLLGQPIDRTRGARVAREGSLRWLVVEYKKSLHFRGLDPVTQRRRDSIFQQMVVKSGDALITKITEGIITDAREKRTAGKGHAANTFLKALKPMFAYAKARGWIVVDPTRTVDFVKTLPGGREAWTMDDVQAYEERHPLGTVANLAMRILLFTGFRRADATLFGKQHIRNGVITFRPGKTENTSEVLVIFTALPPLLEAIGATRTGDLAFLTTMDGTPFESGASFGNWFRDRCVEAGVTKRAHGLRKLGPALAAEAGATANELMAMWGWTTLQQAELYTKSANRKILGESASAKLMAGFTETAQNANTIPRTFVAGAGTGEKAK